jgi:DNA-binding MarR family transcriptional regulator
MSEIYRKRQILEYIDAKPGQTAKDISTALNISVPDAEMFCFRLFRAVLVSREASSRGKFQKPSFRYTVTTAGLDRLNYWKARDQRLDSVVRYGLSDQDRAKRKRRSPQ